MINRESLKIRQKKGVRLLKLRGYKQHEISSKAIGKVGTTPTSCSCWMCGNPRSYFKGKDKLTLQERKALESQKCI